MHACSQRLLRSCGISSRVMPRRAARNGLCLTDGALYGALDRRLGAAQIGPVGLFSHFSTTASNHATDFDWESFRNQLQTTENIESLQEAHSLLVASSESHLHGESLEDARLQIFDAWVRRFDQMAEQNNFTELRRYIEQAQAILEVLVPHLKHNKHHLSDFLIRHTSTSDLELPHLTHDARQKVHMPLTHRCNVLLHAIGKLSRLGHGHAYGKALQALPQRAQYLLEQMETTLLVTPTEQLDNEIPVILRPTVESYNAVMEAWAFSREHMRGNMAEQVFQKISRPNGESYRLVIRAWCLSRDRRAAFHATGHLMKMLRRLENGEEDFAPTLDEYHMIFKAWEVAEDKTSPNKALTVLRLMEQAHEKDIINVRPDLNCYRSVLKTAAGRPQLAGLGRLVDDVLVKMDEEYIIPDNVCYSAAIRTWKNCALHPDNVEFREVAVRRVLQLLIDMKTSDDKSTVLSVQPSTANYNDVLEALSVSRHPMKTQQAEQLLERLEKGLQDEHQSLGPDADSYRHTINVWGTSNSEERVTRALSILNRLLARYESVRQNSKKQDVVEVFNSVIRVCSSFSSQDSSAGLSIFNEALSSIGMMKSVEGLIPNSATYTALLEASRSLLPLGSQQQLVLEEVFRLCADDGMVDDNFLRILRIAATPELFAKLVIAESEDVEGVKMVPESWTANALGGRVITSEGRRTTPLSIDGQLMETWGMKEFRMRKLRDKRNRNLLQGGRLRATHRDLSGQI